MEEGWEEAEEVSQDTHEYCQGAGGTCLFPVFECEKMFHKQEKDGNTS